MQRVENLVSRRIYGSASVFFLQECIKFSVIGFGKFRFDSREPIACDLCHFLSSLGLRNQSAASLRSASTKVQTFSTEEIFILSLTV